MNEQSSTTKKIVIITVIAALVAAATTIAFVLVRSKIKKKRLQEETELTWEADEAWDFDDEGEPFAEADLSAQ